MMSEEKSEFQLLDEVYIEKQKGLISDLECDVHFWKSKAEDQSRVHAKQLKEAYQINEDRKAKLDAAESYIESISHTARYEAAIE